MFKEMMIDFGLIAPEPETVGKRLEREMDQARRDHLHHAALEEEHAAMREMYANRYQRLKTLKKLDDMGGGASGGGAKALSSAELYRLAQEANAQPKVPFGPMNRGLGQQGNSGSFMYRGRDLTGVDTSGPFPRDLQSPGD